MEKPRGQVTGYHLGVARDLDIHTAGSMNEGVGVSYLWGPFARLEVRSWNHGQDDKHTILQKRVAKLETLEVGNKLTCESWWKDDIFFQMYFFDVSKTGELPEGRHDL